MTTILQPRILQPSASRPPAAASIKQRGAMLVVLAMAAAGYGLTVLFLYPGYLTNDATFVHGYVADWHLGDWQSPVMTMLWWLIDPISPGSGSMFLLTAALYWLGFGMIAARLARRAPMLAVAVPLLALAPPGFLLLSMIWRDILFAATWLLAAAMVYLLTERSGLLPFAVKLLAAALVGFGILLRPNAIVAAPLLFAYIVWPARLEWKRTALIFVPALVAGYGLIHLVYYDLLDVKRENPLHSLLVFDLGGITHFSGENQFPVSFSPQETALLTSQCYDPKLWDSYWTLDPCKFVMARLERPDDVIFGTPRLVEAWVRAVTAHPLAYVEHRLTFMWTFLARDKLVLELYKLALPDETPLAHNPYFTALMPLYDTLKSTILYRVGLWVIISVVIIALAWRGRATPDGAFAIGVTSCGLCYIFSFAVLGVASDFRYGYWDVLACLAGLVPALLAWRDARAGRAAPVLSARTSA
jgi:hypothetical protein